MKSIVIGILCLLSLGCISCQSSSKNEDKSNNAEMEAFVTEYSAISIGEEDKVRYASEMPSYENVKHEYDRSLEKLTDYLEEVYRDEKNQPIDVTEDKTYQRLLVNAKINASMLKFYRLTGYYVHLGLPRANAKDIEKVLEVRKEIIEKLISEGAEMPSKDLADFLLLDAGGKKTIADILPSDVPKSVIVDGYAWNKGIISYIEKNRN